MGQAKHAQIDPEHWRELCFSVGKINQKLEEALSKQCDLIRSEFDLMGVLLDSRQESLRMTELQKRLLLTPSGMTRTVNRLVQKRLLKKLAASDDKRGCSVVLLPRGLAVYLRAKDVCTQVLRETDAVPGLVRGRSKEAR